MNMDQDLKVEDAVLLDSGCRGLTTVVPSISNSSGVRELYRCSSAFKVARHSWSSIFGTALLQGILCEVVLSLRQNIRISFNSLCQSKEMNTEAAKASEIQRSFWSLLNGSGCSHKGMRLSKREWLLLSCIFLH